MFRQPAPHRRVDRGAIDCSARSTANSFGWLVFTLLLCACGGDAQPGTFSVAFAWTTPVLRDEAWVFARVEQRTEDAPPLQVAEAVRTRLKPELKLAFSSVPHGKDYVVVVEVKAGSTREARTLLFGESAPFALRPGNHTKVDVALALVEAPTQRMVSVVEANESNYVRNATVTLALRAERATRVIVANDFALSKGRQEASLEDLDRDGDGFLWKEWNLDAALCSTATCSDGSRSVFVQFLNERGYASELATVSVQLDRVAPTLASVSVSPLVAGHDQRVSIVLTPSEPLAQAPTLQVTQVDVGLPLDVGFPPFRQIAGGAYLTENRLSSSGIARQELRLAVSMVDRAGHSVAVELADGLLVDGKAPELVWGVEVRPPVVRDGEPFVLTFELDEVVPELPVLRIDDTPTWCLWVRPSMRRVECHHTATKKAGGGEKLIRVDVRDAAGNYATLEGGSVLYDTLPRCGDGVLEEFDRVEACDDGIQNSNAPDAACRTDCQPRRCGDRVVDTAHGEVCDDGNLRSGDGCSFDCESNETCPNGYVDFTIGETCDDGDFQNHDGCSTRCKLEAATWRPLTSVGPAKAYVAVYDVARQRVVAFGDGKTFEWDGGRWERKSSVTISPSNREAHAMAYDTSRRRVVLFGGENSGGLLGDTWEWDGNRWSLRAGEADGPGARSGMALTFDSARKRLVLFGGGARTDTWEWDGDSWKQVDDGTGAPESVAPHPRCGWKASMAYDPARGVTVLFGGESSPSFGQDEACAETWEWTGQGWAQRSIDGEAPEGRARAAMTYDPAHGRVVMLGGFGDEGSTHDAWAWNGSMWSLLEPDLSAFAGDTNLVFDVARSRLILLGGTQSSDASAYYRNQIWEWAEEELQLVYPPDGYTPATRRNAAVAYDGERGRIVLFGGRNERARSATSAASGQYNFDDTWEWDGYRWQSVGPKGYWQWIDDGWTDNEDYVTFLAPSARHGHAMAYDASRHVTVLFGGWGGGSPATKQDTWEWDGTRWELKSPPSPLPPAGTGRVMVFDMARRELLLLGGMNAEGQIAMWVWNGLQWTERLVDSPVPQGRLDATATYDSARERVVLFGGARAGSTPLTWSNDLWEWDGVAWQQKISAGDRPPALAGAALAYDATSGRALLFGGESDAGESDDTWSWDGERWSLLEVDGNRPAARRGASMAYDVAHAQMVMTGLITHGVPPSQIGAYTDGDVYSLQFGAPADLESCRPNHDGDGDRLLGCADPDCFGFCTPWCNPTLSSCDRDLPHCGDGVCIPLEAALCPTDCTLGSPSCGDAWCSSGESSSTCPGDCVP